MSKEPKLVICRNCNAPIAKNAKICPACGAKNKKPFYKKWWFVLLVIIVGIGVINSIGRNKQEKFDWNEVELCDQLPTPKSNAGSIMNNDSDRLKIRVEKTSHSDYKSYIKSCEDMGYTVESERDGDSFTAFDEAGYKLKLDYIGETMYIELEAPTKMDTLKWPKSEIANLLPIPDSTVGTVSSDTTDGCCILVGDTAIDDFNNYVDKCSDNGFSVDYERGDEFYNAKDENGNELSLTYQGNGIMEIQIKKPDEVKTDDMEEEPESDFSLGTENTEPEQSDSGEEQSNAGGELVDGMRPEFKKSMDSYEEFMNEYCEFMKKYAESDGTDLTMVADYADYMSKYADVVKSFDEWDAQEMNTAETAYYIEVQTRINAKLLEVSQ